MNEKDILEQIASIAHEGGLQGMDEAKALRSIRRITLPWWSNSSGKPQKDSLKVVATDLRNALEMCLGSLKTGLVDFGPYDEITMERAKAALTNAREEGL